MAGQSVFCARFDNYGSGLVTLFVFLFGNNFSNLVDGFTSVTSGWAAFFAVFYEVVTKLILLEYDSYLYDDEIPANSPVSLPPAS